MFQQGQFAKQRALETDPPTLMSMKSQSSLRIIQKSVTTQNRFTSNLKILSPSISTFCSLATLSAGNLVKGILLQKNLEEYFSIGVFKHARKRMVAAKMTTLFGFEFVHEGNSVLSQPTEDVIFAKLTMVQPALKMMPGQKNMSLICINVVVIPLLFLLFLAAADSTEYR